MMNKIAMLSMVLCAASSLHIEGNAVTRKPQYPIENIILERWSPRKMSGESLSQEELMKLFEAARWAPSSYNNQPWRFIYAERGSEAWNKFMNFLVEFNQKWCEKAAALIVVISKNSFDFNGKFCRTHSFDTGASWENMALQGNAMGLVVHGMSGFDYDQAKKELNIPEGYTVEAMVAVGKPAAHNLKALQDVEEVSERKPIDQIVFKNSFSE